MEESLQFNSSASRELKESFQSSLGMTVALISWGMLFATLFLAYTLYRVSEPVWPPMGIKGMPLVIPTLSTLVIALSSVAFHLFYKTLIKSEVSKAKNWYWLTVLLGLGFVGLQFILWKSLKNMGLYSSTGIYGSLIYGFTWIHTAHVVMGILALFYLVPMVHKPNGYTVQQRLLRGQNVGKFWHFLDIVWIMMFVLLFVF